MIPVSNSDYKKAVRLLERLSNMKGTTLREKEAIRQATLLVRKLGKRINGRRNDSNSSDKGFINRDI